MSGGPFSLKIGAWAAAQGARAEAVARNVALEVISRIKIRTPVDTGRLRAAWAIEEIVPGRFWRISNNVEYGRYVEFGTARQSPAGMVTLTVLEFQSIVDLALRLPSLDESLGVLGVAA